MDYFHTGNATEERFSLDRLVLEPLPWPGNPARPADETNLGKYLFEVRDSTRQRDWEEKFLGTQQFATKVGAFEGALYEARALLRRVPARPHGSHRFVRRKIRQVRCGRAVKTDLSGYAPCDNSRA